MRAHFASQDAKWRGRAQRLATAFVTAALSAIWIGPFWAFAWLSFVLAYQGVAAPRLAEIFVEKHAGRDPERFRRNRTIFILVGSCVYAMGWAPAYFMGGEGVLYFAGIWLASSLIHSLIYMSEDRAYLAASVSPHIAAALLGPFFTADTSLLAVVLALATLRMVYTLLIAHRDRTALNEQAVHNRVRRLQAEAASAAKSQFLATMSHELRTPLNAVIGYAEILEEDLADAGDEASASDAARIRRSARELLTLINEVLDFSKIEAGRIQLQPGPTDVNALIYEAAEAARPIAKANNTLITIDAARLGVQEVDAQRLRQCVFNLMSNACKFTQDGRVHVSARLLSERAGASLEIVVKDTGRGLSAEEQERIFQPYTYTNVVHARHAESAGLGLAITRRLARLMGGDVACVSTPGEGAAFTLTISVPRAAAETPDGEGPLILVIDDQAEARELTRRALARLPVRFRGASTAAEGVAAAREETPALIVLDIHLPDRCGWNVLADFRDDAQLKDTPVLVCTIDEDRLRALSLGACDHLLKPVDRERLAAAILRYARRRAPDGDWELARRLSAS